MFVIKEEDLDKLFDYGFKFFGDSYRKQVISNGITILYYVDLQGIVTISYYKDLQQTNINDLQNNIVQLDDTLKVLIDNNIIIIKERENDK